MRNLLALLGAVVVAFGGLGWYLDWFKIMNNPAPSGHRNLNIDINTVKITDDLHRGSVKVQQALEKTKLDAENKAAADGKIDPNKTAQPDLKKSSLEVGGGEAQEDNPFDFRKPR